MIKIQTNKSKILSILLAFAILLVNFNSVAYSIDDGYNSDYIFKETNNGFVMQYEQVENNEIIYYYEEMRGNVVNTKKYNKDNSELKLLEELNTIINLEDNSTTITIENITKNTLETRLVGTETELEPIIDKFALRYTKETHPKDSDYSFSYSTSGHVGVAGLTKAVMIGVIASVITGGQLVAGSIASIATFVLDGGWSNLYYTRTSYGPDGRGPGRPLWKAVVKHYYDRDRTKQAGDTLYYEADILTTY